MWDIFWTLLGFGPNANKAAVRAGPALNVNQNQLKHWRRLEKDGNWRLEYKDKLFMDIGREEMTDVDKPRVLFWGKIQAGKSSFINSIASVDKGRFAQLAAVADSAKRVTRRLGILHLSNNMKNLRIIDVMGLERRGFGGLPADDVQFILRGHVRQNYEFNESDHISQENETFFKADPSDAEKAYCNVLVLSAYDVYGDLIESDMLKTLRDVQSIAHDAGIATILVLTKIDLACPEVQEDVTQVYCSAKIGEVVNKASSMFGIPKMDIFPVKNYDDEVEMETGKDILILLAVRQMVRYVSDRLQQVNLSRNSNNC